VSHGDWFVVFADAKVVFKKKSTEIWRELFLRGPVIEVWNQDEYYFSLTFEEPYYSFE